MSWTNRPVCSQAGVSLDRTVVIDTYTHTLTASCLKTPKELLSSSEMLQLSPLTSITK